MSEKRLDAKNRWRNVVVAFRMSPEEAQELNVKGVVLCHNVMQQLPKTYRILKD